jgi:hypothetical protein
MYLRHTTITRKSHTYWRLVRSIRTGNRCDNGRLRGRRFGDLWLGLRLWQALGLDTLLEDLLPVGREEVPWAKMAAVLVLARFCEPSSELHIAEDWFRRVVPP